MSLLLFSFSSLFALIADQISKWLTQQSLLFGESFPVLPGVLWFTHIHNRGAAFSLFQNKTFLLIGISVLATLVLLWLHRHTPAQQKTAHIGLGLIFGGNLGNLLDRLRYGYVVDFIDLHWWPVFNLADTLINVGIFLVCLDLLFFHKPHKRDG